MNLILLFLFVIVPFEEIEFEDISGNKYEIVNENYILIFLNGWSCVDCIYKATEYFKNQGVSKDKIYFLIESPKDIYSKMKLKKIIENATDYYAAIIFNPNNVQLNDIKNSYFFKYSENNSTPSIIIKSKEFHFYHYNRLFLKDGSVELDSLGIELLKSIN